MNFRLIKLVLYGTTLTSSVLPQNCFLCKIKISLTKIQIRSFSGVPRFFSLRYFTITPPGPGRVPVVTFIYEAPLKDYEQVGNHHHGPSGIRIGFRYTHLCRVVFDSLTHRSLYKVLTFVSHLLKEERRAEGDLTRQGNHSSVTEVSDDARSGHAGTARTWCSLGTREGSGFRSRLRPTTHGDRNNGSRSGVRVVGW